MIGPLLQSLYLTVTFTGAYYRYGTKRGQSTFCIARRAWPKGTPWSRLHIFHRVPQSYLRAPGRTPSRQPAMVCWWRGGGFFGNIITHFKDLQVQGAPRVNFPEPTKTILVVVTRNMSKSNEFFRGVGMTVVTGIHYLGGFNSYWYADTMWLD